MVLVDGRTRREERRCRLSMHQLVGQVVVVIVICPCSSTSCPGMSSSSLSVHVPAGWPSRRRHRPSLHQLGARVVVVCPCGSTSCPGTLLPSVRAPAGWPSCCPRLSRGSSSPSSSPSVLVATQVVVVVCPVARHRRLSHRRSIAIAIAVYPCASYPSHRHCHRCLSRGSSSVSAHGSGHHRSLPLWLVVVIIVAMVGGDSWDWCWRWWHWLVSGSVCAFVMAGSPSS